MMKNLSQAEAALDKFYNTVYREVFRINKKFPFEMYPGGKPSVNSVVVSDCAIIFVDNEGLAEDKVRDLHLVLDVIKSINLVLINPVDKPQIMTTSATAYGHFKYSSRSSNVHTRKSFFYGQTYVKAYLGNEELTKKPGLCRVLDNEFTIPEPSTAKLPFSLLKENNDVLDYYWMLNNAENLSFFKNAYDDLSQSLYKQIAALLLKASENKPF